MSDTPRDRNARSPPVCVADYERLAVDTVPETILSYLAGGAADEITARWNVDAYNRLALVPRVLRGEPGGCAEVTIFGRRHPHPIFVAPVARQKLAHPDGERATAIAADAQGACMTLSCEASISIEEAAATGGTCRWMQIYFQRSRTATEQLVRRAEAAGFEALVLTVDAPINGPRNRESRAGFVIPPHAVAVNIDTSANDQIAPPSDGGSVVFDSFMATAPTWADVLWLVALTRLPVLVKGILDPEDAQLAIDAGAAGIIVSNHGGRTLDTAIATIDVLPDIAASIAGRIPIILDGGVRRGTDVLKALALGATAVMVGRPIVYGLAVNGALGVAHVIRILKDEFEIAMALTGCRTVADIGPKLVRSGR